MSKDLSRILRPRSIAVVGGGWSERVVEQCRKMGFEGDIWPIHPKKTEIAGLPCFAHVDDLPYAPDASFIGVNRHATIDIVKALSARGAGGAVCFASGFKEVDDGASLNDDLLNAAGDMPIFGPNCYGLINYLDGALLWPDQHGGRRVEKGVAIIAQSSNIAINLTMQARGLPVAYVLTVGNQAQTSLAEMIEAVLDDPNVTAIGLHIEGFACVADVDRALRKAHARKMPVVALKVGESEAAQAMTMSHTASLAGADNLVTAFFERLNVARVKSLEEFLETLKILHVVGPLPDNTLGSMSCSGGEASLMGDLAKAAGMDMPALTQSQADAVAITLPDMVSISNPLDYHTFTWGDKDSLTETYAAMLDCNFGLTCLVLDTPRPDRCQDNGSETAIAAAIDAAKRSPARFALVASLAENMTEALADRLEAAGIVPLMGMQAALRAAAAAARIGAGFDKPTPAPLVVGDGAADSGDFEILNEWHAKQLVGSHGVPVPEGRLVGSVEDAVSAGTDIGFPVVLKAVGDDLAHKTELGAVVLNLKTQADLKAAAERLIGLSPQLMVEKMVVDPVAELILGVSRDPQFGLYLTVGAGGVMVELLKDAKPLLLPVTPEEVKSAILSLKTAPLLTGFRGAAVADVEAATDAAMRVVEYAIAENQTLEEMDINPLIVCASGAVAADALVRKRKV
ncbi:acetate--CoA ligase family protein [Aliiroseovarius crassostreae]|uniref:acetate--CoA ligase family protein n=1 Tax=Aliiroseovarius crassostreae TaxID=154981 RepID=UPI003C7CD040